MHGSTFRSFFHSFPFPIFLLLVPFFCLTTLEEPNLEKKNCFTARLFQHLVFYWNFSIFFFFNFKKKNCWKDFLSLQKKNPNFLVLGRWAARGNFFVHRRRTRGFCFFFSFLIQIDLWLWSVAILEENPRMKFLFVYSFSVSLSLSVILSDKMLLSLYSISCFGCGMVPRSSFCPSVQSCSLSVWFLPVLFSLARNMEIFFFFFLNSFFSSLHVYSRLEGTRPFAARLFFVSIMPAIPIHFLAPNLFKFKKYSN